MIIYEFFEVFSIFLEFNFCSFWVISLELLKILLYSI